MGLSSALKMWKAHPPGRHQQNLWKEVVPGIYGLCNAFIQMIHNISSAFTED